MSMDFNDYQQRANETAIYPEEYNLTYPTLGLAGEAGEVAEKVKKIVRYGKDIKAEAERWVDEPIADNGGTVGQYIGWEVGDT